MAQVAIVVTPGMAEDGPALGPHLLQAALRSQGHACDVLYLNLPFAAAIGLPLYRSLERLSSLLPLEWVFAPLVYERGLPPAEAYAEQVLRQPNLELHSLLAARRAAAAFTDHAVTARDWERYDVIGFSSSFQQTNAALALATRLAASHRGTRFVLGGANAEGIMGETLARLFPVLDAVFSGEADLTFPSWVAGAAAAARGTRVPAPEASPVRDMDALPVPDFTDYFAALAMSGLPIEPSSTSLRLEIGRGCWWGERAHCTFCGLNGTAMTWRRKSTPRFLEELRAMTRWPTRSVLLADNILGADVAADLLPALHEARTGFRFFAEVKAPLGARAIRALCDAGVRRIQPGIESLATSSLGRMRKGTRAVENIALLAHAADAGVATTWNLLVGFPRETAADLDRMTALIPFLHHLPPPVGLFPVEFHRFAPLYEEADRLGAGTLRPVAAYRHAHAIAPADLASLAYFFERAEDDWHDEYVAAAARLADAVDDWRIRARAGSCCLLYVDDGRTFHGIDTRPCALESRWTATGSLREFLLACREPLPLPGDAHALAALTARRLVLELDGRALALPLPADVACEPGQHDHALAIAEQLHAGRMRMLVAEGAAVL